jgi:hypothetical protein
MKIVSTLSLVSAIALGAALTALPASAQAPAGGGGPGPGPRASGPGPQASAPGPRASAPRGGPGPRASGPRGGPGPRAGASAPGPGMGPGMGQGMGPGRGPGGMGARGPRWGADYTPGWALMSPQEREEHRTRMQGAKTYDECNTLRQQHREQMAARARERGASAPFGQPRRDACAGLPKP